MGDTGVVSFKHRGNFNKLESFLQKASRASYKDVLKRYGQIGVQALSSATPVDTGLTASSWNFEIHESGSTISIVWTNSNVVAGVPVAILLQYGHGTGTGGYVTGIDYINPALKPIFDDIANAAWKEVIT